MSPDWRAVGRHTSAGALVTANAASSANIGVDQLNGVENIVGSQGNDNITGGAGANVIDGQGGNDVINGGAGDDMLFGGAGNDNLSGGVGNDMMTGDSGDDTAAGGSGNDTFIATAGDGNDSYSGGANDDTLDLSATNAGATVTPTSATSAQIGTDVINTIENVIGSQGNDSIVFDAAANVANVANGQGGNDNLSTGAGADRLIGGAGNDTMNGGTGNDMFVFAAGFGNDVIVGFDASPDIVNGQDRLDISALGINAASFGLRVEITDLGNDFSIEIDGLNTILLQNVDGVGANTVTQADFLLAA